MRPAWIAAGAIALAGLATAASAQSPASWTAPTAPFRIADNLYYVGSAGISTFLITTPQGHILIDGGMPGTGKQIEKSITALGFKPKDVKLLLNTHAHFDHAGGLAELKADLGAPLAASAGDKAALETGTYPGSEDIKAFDFAPVKVDRVLKDGDTVSVGGEVLTAHITPGHTAGCTTWTFPVKVEGKVLRAIAYCSTSVAANRLVSKTKGPQYPGIVADYQKAFATLKTLKADIFLAPHGEQFDMDAKRARLGKGTNPFVDPNELQVRTAASEQAFRGDLAKQQEAAR
ncbi:metallo-beta-lactamase L1 precursor [mine drainage metagenome]|uniref:Metallo-beta-lactamase L1 n=1 Tax=mine drainage metagenome TaxID=410659 RepID=A0A1J5PWU1_9ZZZZ